jgi:hypothetical protein
MRAILEFDLPQDCLEHLRAVKADAAYAALYEIKEKILYESSRDLDLVSMMDGEGVSKEDILDRVRAIILEAIDENRVDLDGLYK